ncbi:MAG: glutamine synthetase, partial [Phycisphaerae bacterium]|nr:glutamine synthetase [Phycisphaerae bacterium]
LLIYTLWRTGLEGPKPDTGDEEKRPRTRFLPGNIYDALRIFKGSSLMAKLMGERMQAKLAELKQMSADRCPHELGTLVKREEVMFHHEVTNQFLWGLF